MVVENGEGMVAAITTRLRSGDRYVVQIPFTAVVLISCSAPFTGGNEKMLPAGLEFVIDADLPAHARAVTAHAEPYAEWECKLVDEADRRAEKYGGYGLVVDVERLAANCALLAGATPGDDEARSA